MRVAKKDLKDHKHNSLHLGRECAQLFVLEHYLFLVAHCLHVPQAVLSNCSLLRADNVCRLNNILFSLSENCLLLGIDNIRGQISEHIFSPNGDYCLNTHDFCMFSGPMEAIVNIT